MTNATLDKIYCDYIADPIGNLERLLAAVREKAIFHLQDEDDAQDFLVSFWKVLPELQIRSSFAGFVARRLEWKLMDSIRKFQNRRETPISHLELEPDDNEELPTEDDKFDILSVKLLEQSNREHAPDPEDIEDPVLRKIADLLMFGHTIKEASCLIGTSEIAVKKRVQRLRRSRDQQLLKAA